MERLEVLPEAPELEIDLSSIQDRMPSEVENPAEYRQFMARLSFVFTSNEFSVTERNAFVLHLAESTEPGKGMYKLPSDVLDTIFLVSKTGRFKDGIRRLLKDDIEAVTPSSF